MKEREEERDGGKEQESGRRGVHTIREVTNTAE